MDLESFKSLRLPGGFILLSIELEDAPMVDAIGRPALAKAVVEGNTVAIALSAAQVPAEMSVSFYHELLEALTVGLADPPASVCDLNEAGFEAAAREAYRCFGLARPSTVLNFLHDFGFTD